MKTEAEDIFLRRGICTICHEQFGNWEELQKHIKAQVESGSLEHKKLDDYIRVAITEDMKKIKTYYEGYPKYEYPEKYTEQYPYVCPICSQRFKTKQAFLVHWASEHQMKYGTYPEFAKEKESLSSEDKRKKELIFIAESLLRKRRKD
jgi:transcriptional regulator NrdR family protein